MAYYTFYPINEKKNPKEYKELSSSVTGRKISDSKQSWKHINDDRKKEIEKDNSKVQRESILFGE